MCELCRTPIIDARVSGEGVVRLDAKPNPCGSFRAFLDGQHYGWVASHAGTGEDSFMGTRRRVHVCPDVQLSM